MVAVVQEVQRPVAGGEIDTVRALLHDLRQPLAAILLMAGTEGGDTTRKFDVIAGQARWLAELVEASLGGGATDALVPTDVAEVAARAVERARTTAECEIELVGDGVAYASARPVALSRALACVLDNAVRAAGEDGHVRVEVHEDPLGVHLSVVDDGPGLGKITSRTSLGLTTTRAMVASCGGSFEIRGRAGGGVEADIRLAGAGLRSVAS
jgi:signal transduction histidine kinase